MVMLKEERAGHSLLNCSSVRAKEEEVESRGCEFNRNISHPSLYKVRLLLYIALEISTACHIFTR